MATTTFFELEQASASGQIGYDPCPSVVDHLFDTMERERTALARTLHDELGGLLVAAVMDVAYTERLFPSSDDMQSKLSRIRRALDSAVDLKRSLTEDLRPSLLDNLGLFTAMRWHLDATVERTGVPLTQRYPAQEPAFKPQIATSLFRIVQECILWILAEGDLASIDVGITIDQGQLQLSISHEHIGLENWARAAEAPIILVAIAHRIRAIEGSIGFDYRARGTTLRVQLPLAQLIDA